MADIITEIPESQEQAIIESNKQELSQQMSIALNGGIVPASTENIQPETQPTTEPEDIPLTFETIKEKFGYEKAEDAIKEIEELRNYKATPAAPEPIRFANDFSEKVFKALQSDKPEDIKQVSKLLAEQDRIDNLTSVEITKDNAADIIKMGMSLKYKDFTQADIDYRFKKQFALPKEPVQALEEPDEDFEIRKNEWKSQVNDIEQDKIIEAKLIKPELEAHKSKLVLPETIQQVDEDYIKWKKSQDELPKLNAEIAQAYKAITPELVETKINFNDEANKIAFEFQYKPASEDLAKAADIAGDFNKFFDLFISQDGKPDRERFIKAIDFAINPEKVLMEAMKQSKNATLKAQLPDNNVNGGRQLMQQTQVSDLDLQMQNAGIRRN